MELSPGYKPTSVGNIPHDWVVVKVGSIGSFSSGTGIRVGSLSNESSHSPIPVYGGNGIAGYTTRALVGEPTVVIGRVGQHCGEVHLTGGPAWISDNALYPRAIHVEVDLQFLGLALSCAGLNDVKNRNDLPLVTQAILHSVELPWPPDLNEQRRIAEVMHEVDDLLGGLRKVIAKKRDLKQATMQRLLTGEARLPGFTDKWEVRSLNEVADVLKGSGLSKSVIGRTGQRPCILYGELFTTYGRVIKHVVSRTDAAEGLLSRAGDVLMPGSTTTSGIDLATASALALDNVALGGDILVIRRKSTAFDSAFLAHYLTHVRKAAVAELSQGITIHHLYGKDLKRLALRLPPSDEQSAIATVLSDMDAELAALEARFEKTKALKQAMMQELLTGRTRLMSPEPAHA